jgi:hypothetical protein
MNVGAVTLLFITGYSQLSFAQPPARQLRIQLVDSLTQVPIRRPYGCIYTNLSSTAMSRLCAKADTLGWLRFDSIPPGSHEIELTCDSGPMFQRIDFGVISLTESDSGGMRGIRRVDGSRCDQRPFETSHRVFEGFYTSGFEESSFVECRESHRLGAWVEFNSHAGGPRRLPKTINYAPGYPMWWVRFLAARSGPSHYGHLGVSEYLLRVDSILEVRRPRRSDCDGWRPHPQTE